jgi:Ca2+/H+ antiporter
MKVHTKEQAHGISSVHIYLIIKNLKLQLHTHKHIIQQNRT